MKIKVHIQPGAKKDEIVGQYGDAIKIKLKAPPMQGKANEALIDLLAEKYGVKRSEIKIIHGLTSRDKIVSIGGH